MADLTQLDVVAEVYESDLTQVKVGQKAYISAKGFNQVYTAEVRELGYMVRKMISTIPILCRTRITGSSKCG